MYKLLIESEIALCAAKLLKQAIVLAHQFFLLCSKTWITTMEHLFCHLYSLRRETSSKPSRFFL